MMAHPGGWAAAAILLLAAAGMGLGLLLLASLLGPRRPRPGKGATYECGATPVGDARERFPVRFYLVGVLFLLFDLETVLLVPWGVAARGLGWRGFASGAAFIAVLALGLAYAWNRGVLDCAEDGHGA